jgi:cytoskeleton protein RodZ
MVRQYSRLLGLDADAMVARASQAAPTPDQLAERFQQPVPFSNQSRRSNLAYVALSIVLLGVVAAVALQWRHEIGSRAQPSFVSAAQQPAEPAKATPVEIPAAQPVAEVNAPSAEAAPAEPAPTGPLARLVLRFAEESWVEIHSGSGKLLVSHLHPAGGERVVTGVPPFSVVIGNAEHVKLTYNDRPVDLAPYIKVEVARFTLE